LLQAFLAYVKVWRLKICLIQDEDIVGINGWVRKVRHWWKPL